MLLSPLFAALLLAAGSTARADGVVVAVQEADEVGAWSTWQPALGTTTAEAYLLRGDERVPVAVGDTVRDHDLVITRRGRLQLEVPNKGTITIYDDTRVELQDFGLTHQLGGLLIEVQDAFRVEYVQVEAVVEGTRFRVEGDATGRGLVLVEEGRVRVANPEGEVKVSAGELARLVPGMPPAKEVADSGRRTPAGRRFHPLSIGPQLGGGLGNHIGLSGAAGEVRADGLARLRLPGPFAVAATTGIVNSTTTTHFPVSTSFEVWLGPIGFGAAGDLMLGVKETCDPPSRTLVVSAAGHATANLSLPLSSRWLFDSRLLVGWSTGPQVFATTGVSFRP